MTTLAQQPTSLTHKLQSIRLSIETALRYADDGQVDYSAQDLICLNCLDAIRLLKKLEDESSPVQEPPVVAKDCDVVGCVHTNHHHDAFLDAPPVYLFDDERW